MNVEEIMFNNSILNIQIKTSRKIDLQQLLIFLIKWML